MPADPDRARDLFQTAALLPDPSARRAFLDRESAGDPALRGRVDALLAAFRAAPPPAEPPGQDEALIAGRFRLREPLGEGGMGSVYRADQIAPVKRSVALKLIKPGMDSREVLARFEMERQALALMDHPHIARVLDAGTTDKGRPFFVMELVNGVPITDYCDLHRLDVPARLALFRQVCGAVQHAHQKGVIHRDLKPTNVLVETHDETPVPKVIDFGLAKAVAGAAIANRTLRTEFGFVVGTPLYMAPEQATFDALDVDTRADIYALGAILYELLTGGPPIPEAALSKTTVDEMLRLVRETDPPTPSHRLAAGPPGVAAARRAEPGQLRRLVRGDLDWVVMKALAKERHRRYETAAGLAADIERFLNHEPVSAGPPGAGYRVRKFVRRNRGPVAAAAAVLVALVAGVVGTTAGLVEARRQERRAVAEADAANAARQAEAEQRKLADAERAKAEAARKAAVEKEAEANAVIRFIEDKVFAAARPKGFTGGLGYDVTLKAAIDAAVPAVATGFRGQPLVEARLRNTLGGTYYYLGEYAAAVLHQERSRAIYAERLGPDHPDTLRVARNLAIDYAMLKRHADALRLREDILAAHRRAHGPDHRDTLQAVADVAASHFDAGRKADALKTYEEVLAAQRRLLGPDHPDAINTLEKLATAVDQTGHREEGLRLREEVAAAYRRVRGPDHPSTLGSLTNLANSYGRVGRLEDACRTREEVLAAQRRLLGPDHPSTQISAGNLVVGLNKLARGRAAAARKLADEGQAAEAAAEADRAMDALTRAVAAGAKGRSRWGDDPELAFLRDRADFRALVTGRPAEVAPPPRPAAGR